ncbi:hypothetical protein [Kitasatospora sp. NPDC088346]|uniref:hypothetical protein n=1 Tax=Kitasatospora sp. NPDC088346 TaxID=3364073 RepID=UPI003809693D
MPRSAESTAVERVLRRHGFEEIGEVPAVPAAGALRYRRAVTLEPGAEPWYLRSSGTDFTILPRPWLRRGLRRCWSLGRDLDEGGERDGLLLAQAVEAEPAEIRRLAAVLRQDLAGAVTGLRVRTGREHDQACLWLSAHVIGVPA